ncbi:hypothetical protein ACS0TY_014084 [Phlomoides rotata]
MGCAQSVGHSSSRRLETMKYASRKSRERKSSISSNGSEKDKDEEIDGWPKWLIDNIPRDVLKDIVPKSADSYVKIDKIGEGTYNNVYKAKLETGKAAGGGLEESSVRHIRTGERKIHGWGNHDITKITSSKYYKASRISNLKNAL